MRQPYRQRSAFASDSRRRCRHLRSFGIGTLSSAGSRQRSVQDGRIVAAARSRRGVIFCRVEELEAALGVAGRRGRAPRGVPKFRLARIAPGHRATPGTITERAGSKSLGREQRGMAVGPPPLRRPFVKKAAPRRYRRCRETASPRATRAAISSAGQGRRGRRCRIRRRGRACGDRLLAPRRGIVGVRATIGGVLSAAECACSLSAPR